MSMKVGGGGGCSSMYVHGVDVPRGSDGRPDPHGSREDELMN